MSSLEIKIYGCLDTPIDWTQGIKACNLHTLTNKVALLPYPHTRTHANTLKPQHLKRSSLSPNTPGNVFLLWGGLSGVFHWSQPSVINCHNASKLTNGLCVKEGPLIYWPPLVDPEPIISIMAGFHVWASSPTNPRFLCLTLHRFPGTCREGLWTVCIFNTYGILVQKHILQVSTIWSHTDDSGHKETLHLS